MKENPKPQKSMSKKSLVASISEISGLSKASSAQVLEEMMRFITKGLKDGNDVKLPGFGSFRAIQCPASNGKNPRTGEKIKIPAQKRPKFRPSRQLKDAIA